VEGGAFSTLTRFVRRVVFSLAARRQPVFFFRSRGRVNGDKAIIAG
jgi:hypothetical protein